MDDGDLNDYSLIGNSKNKLHNRLKRYQKNKARDLNLCYENYANLFKIWDDTYAPTHNNIILS